MSEDKFNHLLKNFPGARRAAQGILIPLEKGGFFHVRSVHEERDMAGLSQNERFYFEFCSKKEILRLRELRGAHDYLLRIRANAIVDSPRELRVMTSRRNEFEKSGRTWSLQEYYHSKDHYHKTYISYLSRLHSKILKRIPSGFALVKEANAVCIRSFVGDVVVVSESLEHFYYFMSLAFYGNQIGISLKDRVDGLLIALRIMNGSEAQDFDLDPRGKLPPEIERFLKKLVTHQMQFTFGHEYAHLLLGHLSSPDTKLKQVSIETKEAYRNELRIYAHNLEFEADLGALKHIQNNPDAFNEVAKGAFSVLLYLDFLDKARMINDIFDFSVSETHPVPLDRIQKLTKDLSRKAPINNKVLSEMLDISNGLLIALKERIIMQPHDILTFYGSLYLSSYQAKILRDRIDF